jgi:hypothetical protein
MAHIFTPLFGLSLSQFVNLLKRKSPHVCSSAVK